MRGWIYVATAADRGGRVWIGHAAADPATEAARGAGAPRRIEYDAVVAAPRDVVALVRARLAPLATPDGAFRCSPEFAIAAIHHALGGPAEGERIYFDDAAPPPSPRDPVDALAGLAARSGRRERGGALRSLAAPGLLLMLAVALAMYAGTHPAMRSEAPPAAEQSFAPGPARMVASRPQATAAAPRAAADEAGPPEAPPVDEPAVVEAPRAPMTAADCRTLWTVLPRCAALPKGACSDAEQRLAERDREPLVALRTAGVGFNGTAFANFCRAACRHGYRPSREDFAINVCREAR